MSIHYVILNDLSNAPRELAYVDVSAQAAVNGVVTVWASGGTESHADVIMSPDLLASTKTSALANLIGAANGKEALVEMRFDGALTRAVLRQRAGATKILMDVPRKEEAVGTKFCVPVSDLDQSTQLLVGNPGSAAVTVNHAGASYNVPAKGVVKIPVTKANAAAVVDATANVIVQLAVDSGKVDQTFIRPI